MRLHFDYNEPSPETIAEVLKIFLETFKGKTLNEGGHVEIGSINIYVTLKSSEDHKSLCIYNENQEEMMWTIKKSKMKKTNKKELLSTDNYTIYSGVQKKGRY